MIIEIKTDSKEVEGKNFLWYRSTDDRRPYNPSYNNRRYEKQSDNDRDSRERKDLKNERKGNDWECGKCRSNNYPHRIDCFKCGYKRYSNNPRESTNDKHDESRKGII